MYVFRMLTIQHCHLVIINVYPCKMTSQVSNRTLREVCNSKICSNNNLYYMII